MNRRKTVVSLLLVLVMMVALVPQMSQDTKASGEVEKYPYTIFAESAERGITVEARQVTVNGKVYTNGVFNAQYESGNVNGTIVDSKVLEENPALCSSVSSMIYMFQRLNATYFEEAIIYDEDYCIIADNTNLNKSEYTEGNLMISGNLSLNASIGARNDIQVIGENVNGGNGVIWAKFGDIVLEAKQLNVGGLIYAPFGTVTLTADNINSNAIIIAQEVQIICEQANLNSNDSMAQFIGTEGEEFFCEVQDWECLEDADGDGIPNIIERQYGTDSMVADTDGDGLTDMQELFRNATDPLEIDTDGNGIIDSEEDFDGDGLWDGEEANAGSLFFQEDSDQDGLSDGEEKVQYGTNPVEKDSDGDGLSDGEEQELSLDPMKYDTDEDGICDGQEYIMQTIRHTIEEDDVIRSVQVSLDARGSVASSTKIRSIWKDDRLCSDVVGLIGHPYSITADTEFNTATITFYLNLENLGETNPEDLLFLWYDEENACFVELDTRYDAEQKCVSTTTTHFSRYMIVDKYKWYAAWQQELNYNPSGEGTDVRVNTILVFDCSGSMAMYDPIQTTHIGGSVFRKTCMRIDAGAMFIANMDEGDKSSVITFSTAATVQASLTDERTILSSALQKMSTSGGTNYTNAVSSAIAQFPWNDLNQENIYNQIILLSDGEDTILNSVLLSAGSKGIEIHTVGFGNASGDAELRRIANYAGGEFFKAFTADELLQIYERIGLNSDFDTTDTDGDGLYDAVESAGIRLQNGKVIHTDPTQVDTDGDGLLDGEEIDPSIRWKYVGGVPSQVPDEYQQRRYYFVSLSDPVKEDSDEDLVSDEEEQIIESKPWIMDTDGDSLPDGQEFSLGYDPLTPDFDDDGCDDAQELAKGTDPYVPNYEFKLINLDFMEGLLFGNKYIDTDSFSNIVGRMVSECMIYGDVRIIRDALKESSDIKGFVEIIVATYGSRNISAERLQSFANEMAEYFAKRLDIFIIPEYYDDIISLIPGFKEVLGQDVLLIEVVKKFSESPNLFLTREKRVAFRTFVESIGLAEYIITTGSALPDATHTTAVASDVWSKGPVLRGTLIDDALNRHSEGYGLGLNFPVADRIEDEVLVSTKSIDLASKAYQSPEKLKKALDRYVSALVNFEERYMRKGDVYNWGESSVYKTSYTKKRLEVVMPNILIGSEIARILDEVQSQSEIEITYIITGE